jgi:hypothetical protein
MTTIYEFLIHTPWWVYILFFFLLYIGIKAMQPGTVSIYKLMILPVVFLLMSMHTLQVEMSLGATMVIVWVLGLAGGIVIGAWHSKKHYLGRGSEKMTVKVDGSSITLLLILFIFAAKYYFGYMLNAHPEKLHELGFAAFLLACYGFGVGVFVGRVIYFLMKLKKT